MIAGELGVGLESVIREKPSVTRRDGTGVRTAETAVLRQFILLAGSVRVSSLSDLVERSVLDLPLAASAEGTTTVGERWVAQVKRLQSIIPEVTCQLVLDDRAIEPSSIHSSTHNLLVRRDPQPYRGTAGLLSDLAHDRKPRDFILVADAAQLLTVDLNVLYEELKAVNADVVLTANRDMSAGGVTLIRTAVLDTVPSIGFRDLKEQVLPSCRNNGFTVRILQRDQLPGLPVREASEYLSAVHHDRESKLPNALSAKDHFSLIEPGANVDPGAHIYRSVVLSDATVEAGAKVIRSVVCRGATIRSRERIADQIVGRTARREINLAR